MGRNPRELHRHASVPVARLWAVRIQGLGRVAAVLLALLGVLGWAQPLREGAAFGQEVAALSLEAQNAVQDERLGKLEADVKEMKAEHRTIASLLIGNLCAVLGSVAGTVVTFLIDRRRSPDGRRPSRGWWDSRRPAALPPPAWP